MDIRQESLALDIQFSLPGTRRKVDPDEVITGSDVDTSLMHVAKDILDTSALKAIRKLDSRAKAWLRERRLDQSILRGGLYLLPLGLVSEVEAYLTAYRAERAEQVETFLAAYPALRADARERLGSQYDPDDYPDADELRRAFAVDFSWLEISVPGALARADREAYERHLAASEVKWTAAADEIRDALRASFAGLLGHMVDRLGTDPETGKLRVFRDSAVEKITAFLDTFEARNLTRDADLQALVTQAREVMAGVTPGNLREVVNVREAVRGTFERLGEQMAGMITTAPVRRLRLEEPEDTAPIVLEITPEVRDAAIGDARERVEAARSLGLFGAPEELPIF